MSNTYRLEIQVDSGGAKQGIDNLKASFEGLEKGTNKAGEAINQLDQKTGIVAKTFDKVKSTLSNTKAGFKEFIGANKQAKQEAEQLKSAIEKLGFSIDNGKIKNAKGAFVQFGGEADKASAEVKKLTAEFEKLGVKVNAKGALVNAKGEVVKLGDSADVAREKMKNLGDNFAQVGRAMAVGFVAASGVVTMAVRDSMELETSIAGLKKVVDFDTPDGLKNLRSEFEKLSTQIPVSTKELFEMAAAGGQLGVPADKLKEFTLLTAQMATAFDMSAEVAGDSMAKLANVFDKPIESMGEFGDMINTVSNNMPAKASEIVNSLGRIGGSAKAFGLTEKQAVALSSAMISLGKAPEVASTAINSMITTLSTLDTKDKDVAQSLQAMGLNATDFGKKIKEDGYEAIMLLLDGINQLPKDEQIGMATDLFGKNFGDDILQLATAPAVLEKINGLLAESQNYTGSMAKEAENVANTSQAKMEMFKNAIENASAAFGDSFSPALAAVADSLMPVIESFTAFAKENPEIVAGVSAIVLGLTGLATIAVTVAAVLPTVVSGFKLMSAGIGLISSPITLAVVAIGALVAAGVYLYRNWDTIKAKASEIWESVKAKVITAFEGIKQSISNAWQSIQDSISSSWQSIKDIFVNSPIAQAVVAKFTAIKDKINPIITAIGAVIRLGVGGFLLAFKTAFDTIKTIIQTAFGVVKGIVTGDIEAVKQAISKGLSKLGEIARNAIDKMVDAFKSAGATLKDVAGDIIQGLINGIKAKAGALASSVKEVATGALNTFKSVFRTASPSKATREIGEWVAEGLAQGIDAKAQKAIDNAEKMANQVLVAAKPKTAKEAQKLQEKNAKDAQKQREKQIKDAQKQLDELKKSLADAETALERNIFQISQKQLGNPFAELTTAIKFGDYGNLDTSKLQSLTEQNKAAENQLLVLDEIKKIKQDIAKAGMNSVQIAEWEFNNTDKYLGVSRELFDTYINALDQINQQAAKQVFDDELAEINKQLALIGNADPLAEALYDLDNAAKYAEMSAEQIGILKDKMNELQQAKDALAAKQAFEKLSADTFGGNLSASDQLALQYAQKLSVIDEYERLHTDKVAEATALREQIDNEYWAARQDLQLSSYQESLGAVAGFAKDILGESSRGYKAIFAMEKGMALARIFLENKTALAKAWASAPFPQNLAAVGKTLAQSGALVSAVNAIRPVIGQAHDGIMSVPKSGTWNLEKGERVLPKHTAKALDDKLSTMGGGGGQTVIVNVTVNSDGTANVDSQAQLGKQMGEAIKVAVQQEMIKQTRQGGILYGR